jgi:hypothetical protein
MKFPNAERERLFKLALVVFSSKKIAGFFFAIYFIKGETQEQQWFSAIILG